MPKAVAMAVSTVMVILKILLQMFLFSVSIIIDDLQLSITVGGCVIMKFAYHRVILSNAKDLITSTLCIQIFRFAQNDTTF